MNSKKFIGRLFSLVFSLVMVFCVFTINVSAWDDGCGRLHNYKTKTFWIRNAGDDTTLQIVQYKDDGNTVEQYYPKSYNANGSISWSRGGTISWERHQASDGDWDYKITMSSVDITHTTPYIYFTTSDPGWIPTGWSVGNLGSIGVSPGGGSAKPQNPDSWNGNTAFIYVGYSFGYDDITVNWSKDVASLKHTLTYNKNGGTGDFPNAYKVYGTAYYIPNRKPSADGRNFKYWSSNGEFTQNGKTQWTGNSNLNKVYIRIVDTNTMEILVNSANSSITKVQVPTWTSRNNQDDIKWHNLSKGYWERDGQTYNWGAQITHSDEPYWREMHVYGLNSGGSVVAATQSSGYPSVWYPGANYTWDQEGGTVTLNAIYDPWVHTVKYNLNGGSGTFNSQTKTWGIAMYLHNSTPTRTGYTFTGWKDSHGKTWSPGQNYDHDYDGGTNTMTAQWTPKNYTVDLNGTLDGKRIWGLDGVATADIYINGKLVANDVSDYGGKHAYGSTYKLTDIKVNSKYKCTSGDITGTIKGDVDLNPIFVTNQYSLTVDPNGGTWNGSSSSQSMKVTVGDTKTISRPTRTGYTFAGWSNSSNFTGSLFVNGQARDSGTGRGTFSQKGYEDHTNYKWSNITNNSANNWNNISFGYYNVSAGDKVRITGKIKVNSLPSGMALNLYHGAKHNDYENSKLSLGNTGGVYKDFSIERTFTSATSTAVFEIYTSNISGKSGNIDFDLKDIKIENLTKGTYVQDSVTMPSSNVRLTAKWVPNVLTIRYHLNGGTDIASESTFGSGDPAATIKYNYPKTSSNGLLDVNNDRVTPPVGYETAKLWNTKADGSGTSFDFTTSYSLSQLSKAIEKGNVTLDLYAQWFNRPPKPPIIVPPIDPPETNSNIPPYLDGNSLIVQKGDPFNPLDYVKAEDEEDGDITDRITVKENPIPYDKNNNTSEAGEYVVIVQVTDNGGETTEAEINVIVNDKPLIAVQDRWFFINEPVDSTAILEKAEAFDKEDGDITDKINIISIKNISGEELEKDKIDTTQAGIYFVTYEVTDKYKASNTCTAKVNVVDKDIAIENYSLRYISKEHLNTLNSSSNWKRQAELFNSLSSSLNKEATDDNAIYVIEFDSQKSEEMENYILNNEQNENFNSDFINQFSEILKKRPNDGNSRKN